MLQHLPFLSERYESTKSVEAQHDRVSEFGA